VEPIFDSLLLIPGGRSGPSGSENAAATATAAAIGAKGGDRRYLSIPFPARCDARLIERDDEECEPN
jgi:hypothetical protein